MVDWSKGKMCKKVKKMHLYSSLGDQKNETKSTRDHDSFPVFLSV